MAGAMADGEPRHVSIVCKMSLRQRQHLCRGFAQNWESVCIFSCCSRVASGHFTVWWISLHTASRPSGWPCDCEKSSGDRVSHYEIYETFFLRDPIFRISQYEHTLHSLSHIFMNPSWFIPHFDPMTFSGNPRCQRRVGHLFCQRPTAFAWDLSQSCAPLTKGFPLVTWKSPIKNGAWEIVGKFLEVNVVFSIYPLDLISLCSKNTNPQHFHHHFHICASFLFVFFYQQMYFDDSQLVTPVAGVAFNELCPK